MNKNIINYTKLIIDTVGTLSSLINYLMVLNKILKKESDFFLSALSNGDIILNSNLLSKNIVTQLLPEIYLINNMKKKDKTSYTFLTMIFKSENIVKNINTKYNFVLNINKENKSFKKIYDDSYNKLNELFSDSSII